MHRHVGYWMYESSGRLKDIVPRFLRGEDLKISEIELLRDYLVQYTSAMCLPRRTKARIENIRAVSHLRDVTKELLDWGVDPW